VRGGYGVLEPGLVGGARVHSCGTKPHRGHFAATDPLLAISMTSLSHAPSAPGLSLRRAVRRLQPMHAVLRCQRTRCIAANTPICFSRLRGASLPMWRTINAEGAVSIYSRSLNSSPSRHATGDRHDAEGGRDHQPLPSATASRGPRSTGRFAPGPPTPSPLVFLSQRIVRALGREAFPLARLAFGGLAPKPGLVVRKGGTIFPRVPPPKTSDVGRDGRPGRKLASWQQ